jgi:hypothetical protein
MTDRQHKIRFLFLNPFIQLAFLTAIFGSGMMKWNAEAWTWAYSGLVLFSTVNPLVTAFRTPWIENLIWANAAYVCAWIILFALGGLASPPQARPVGEIFLFPAMLYVYLTAGAGLARAGYGMVRKLA